MPKDVNPALPIGTILNGKWIILEFIAKGGMGEIYRAHQLNLKRDVAIKIISREWLSDISEDKEEIENALKRFRQEVHTMVQIRHPNVIQIYDYDSADIKIEGRITPIEYIVLEYIPGRTLRGTMPGEGFRPEEGETVEWLKKYFLAVLDGVEAIHKTGIFHRDIKPENVLMDRGVPKIADFGLARSCRLESMTCSLEIKGTPAYMAPEQFVDFKRTDQRTDIYALGKILFEAIDGKIPANTIPFKKANLKEAETPFFQEMDQIIQKATSEESNDRFESVEQLRGAILDAIKLVKAAPIRDEPERSVSALTGATSRPSALRTKKTWISAIGITISAIGFSFWGYHYLVERGPSLPQKKTVEITGRRTSPAPGVSLPETLSPEIEATDGVTLRLIPGGMLHIPAEFHKGPEKTVTLKPFYMDEAQVTNHQYVNFLNQALDRIQVEEGAVRHDDQIWLYLGEVMEGYEPIIFTNGRFQVKNSAHAACPVVRVTAYGAAAYANFYKRRLPTKSEWLFAALEGKDPGLDAQKRTPFFPASFFEMVKLPYPVMLFKPNAYGIRGMNENIGEWVLSSIVFSKVPDNVTKKYAILGGLEKSSISRHLFPRPVIRQPWEAFEEVGFRCVREIEQGPGVKPDGRPFSHGKNNEAE